MVSKERQRDKFQDTRGWERVLPWCTVLATSESSSLLLAIERHRVACVFQNSNCRKNSVQVLNSKEILVMQEGS